MPRFAMGVTLKPHENASVSQTSTAHSDLNAAKACTTHSCQVLLPNGASCQVEYRRHQAKSHTFTFRDPVSQRVLVSVALRGIPAIEGKAQELVPEVFRKAQETEQAEMRRKVPAGRKSSAKPDGGPEMESATAERLAGRYAACLKTATGRLIRLGAAFLSPEAAVQEIQSGTYRNVRLVNGQTLVVGICNRVQRRWIEPHFLPGQAPGGSSGEDDHTDAPHGARTPSCTDPDGEETR
jgi:hypothetical protein